MLVTSTRGGKEKASSGPPRKKGPLNGQLNISGREKYVEEMFALVPLQTNSELAGIFFPESVVFNNFKVVKFPSVWPE
jgi:hypothetical protein